MAEVTESLRKIETESDIKRLEKTQKHINKINRFIEAYERRLLGHNITRRLAASHARLTRGLSSVNQGIAFGSNHIALNFADLYKKFMTNEHVYNVARWTTTPINWFWYNFLKMKGREAVPVLQEGTHFIYALPGGGKSSLLKNIADTLLHQTGKGAYINVDFEKPRWDSVKKIWYKLHPLFNELKYWGLKIEYNNLGQEIVTSSQLLQFDTDIAETVMVDELLSTFNQRENKTSAYNNVFIGMMKSVVHQRHQGIKRMYFASQIDTADVQLLKTFKYVHQVKVVKDARYWPWVKDGKFHHEIIGWWITSFYKSDKNPNKVLHKKYFIPSILDLEYFNSLNMAHLYNQLPKESISYERGRVLI